jgi:molecular chaperone HscA
MTGVHQTVEVKPSYGLSEDEMAEMLRQSMENAADDMTIRLLTEAKVEAERVLLALDAALKADGGLLNSVERREIDVVAATLRDALTGPDRDAISAGVKALDAATVEFASRRMDQGMRNALRGINIDHLSDLISR